MVARVVWRLPVVERNFEDFVPAHAFNTLWATRLFAIVATSLTSCLLYRQAGIKDFLSVAPKGTNTTLAKLASSSVNSRF